MSQEQKGAWVTGLWEACFWAVRRAVHPPVPQASVAHRQLSLHICHLQLLAGGAQEAGWSCRGTGSWGETILTSCETGCLEEKSQSELSTRQSVQSPSVPDKSLFQPALCKQTEAFLLLTCSAAGA